LFTASKDDVLTWVLRIRRFEKLPILDEFDMGKQIGRGKFSIVYEVTSKLGGEKRALKLINKD